MANRVDRQQSRVFVSYSHHDEEFVTPIVKIMRAIGSEVFQDKDSIALGERWQLVIEKSIEISHIMLLFWCQHSQKSEQVRAEWNQALALGKRLVPIRLDGTPPPSDLVKLHALDFTSVSHPEVEKDLVLYEHSPSPDPPEIRYEKLVASGHSHFDELDVGDSASLAMVLARVVGKSAVAKLRDKA